MNDRRRNDNRPQLKPTANQTFELSGHEAWDFAAQLERSYRMQEEGRTDEACNLRYAAVRRLAELMPDDEPTVLEWGHRNSRAALEILHASAVDHFLAGDFEMSAAIGEMLLDLDPEDHTECVSLLGWCYVAMEEYELLGETLGDIPDTAEKHVMMLWASFRQTGRCDEGEVRTLRERHAECWEEFRAAEHPADGDYLSALAQERPSRRTLARRLWLMTEHLWTLFPDFPAALRGL